MRGIRPSVAVGTATVLGLAIWAGAVMDQTGSRMATAAERFVASLDEGQKAKAMFGFDDPERLNWHFIPRARKGLPLKEMTPEQRALAFGLLHAGLSASGAIKATTIMSLEAILRDLEKGTGPVRDPELYYVSIFGTPSNRGSWGWRVEGHHLSLNMTVQDGVVRSATPAFFGANPAEVREGPRKGLRTLADFEDLAIRLVQSLDESQRRAAVVSEQAPRDISSNSGQGPGGGLPAKPKEAAKEGIAASQLNENQRQLLTALIRAYASDMPDEVARAWLGEVEDAGTGIHFAWYGPAERNQPHGYQVEGPTFRIEFNNTQNGANHIHSLWRNQLGDFGLAAR